MPSVERAREPSGIVDGESSRRVAASHCRLLRVPSRVLVVGYAVPTHFPEIGHKENLYGSSKSTFAAGAFGPAPIPTLRFSLVDCEI
jgi:hypothetical protein